MSTDHILRKSSCFCQVRSRTKALDGFSMICYHSLMAKKIRKAVIPAAGFGTRFLPQTKAMPKEMLPVVDKPVIQYVVEEAVSSGIEDIVIVTGALKRAIEDHFDQPNAELLKNLEEAGKTELLEGMHTISDMANFV